MLAQDRSEELQAEFRIAGSTSFVFRELLCMRHAGLGMGEWTTMEFPIASHCRSPVAHRRQFPTLQVEALRSALPSGTPDCLLFEGR